MPPQDQSAVMDDTQFLQQRIDEFERLFLAGSPENPTVKAYLDDLRQQIEVDIERRDKVLAAVKDSCTRLMRTSQWHDEIVEILRVLGEASDTDRTAVFQFSTHGDRLHATMIFAWDRLGVDIASNPLLQNFDLVERGYGELIEKFKLGQAYYFHRSQRPLGQTLVLDTQTSLNIPIFANRNLWGCLHLSTTRNIRTWSTTELNVLQIAADVLGAAIERLEAEDALRQSEERMRQAVRLGRIGIWDWDVATDNVEWNDEMFRIYGVTREAFTGKGSDYINFTRADYREGQIASITKAFELGMTTAELKAGKPFQSAARELCIVRPDGTECFTLGDAISILDPHGKPLRMLGVTLDITEHKQAEEALRERDRLQLALEKEQEMNTIKTNIMRTISHEFRTPLAVILSSSSMIQRYHERLTPEQRRSRIAVIEAQVKHLDLMVSEISTMMHETLEQNDFEPRLSNLEQLCERNVADLQNTLGGEHRLHFSSDGQLKSVWIDERLVQRIVINLLTNAMKYSPEHTDITLRLSADDGFAVIEVEDHGIGIPEEDQVRLFEPFFRGSNVSGVSGTGLGLSIVRECARKHRGRITMQSEVGQGTTFTVRLPVMPQTAN